MGAGSGGGGDVERLDDNNACLVFMRLIKPLPRFAPLRSAPHSIPLVWSSPMEVGKYNPKVRISPSVLGNGEVCYRHMKRLERKWGGVGVCNLVDKGEGGQGRLGEAFEGCVEATKKWGANVVWGWEDFHEVTKRMGYDEGVEVICDEMERVMKEVEKGENVKGEEMHAATPTHSTITNLRMSPSALRFAPLSPPGCPAGVPGVLRVNCMDCLDRTNVVQAAYCEREFRKWVLGSSAHGKSITKEGWKDFKDRYRVMWSDNADHVAMLYAGTKALKRDYTRTGRRGVKGKVEDGYNSGVRWIGGNFWDARRQRGFDGIVGLGDEGMNDNEGGIYKGGRKEEEDEEGFGEGDSGEDDDDDGDDDGDEPSDETSVSKRVRVRRKGKDVASTKGELKDAMRRIYEKRRRTGGLVDGVRKGGHGEVRTWKGEGIRGIEGDGGTAVRERVGRLVEEGVVDGRRIREVIERANDGRSPWFEGENMGGAGRWAAKGAAIWGGGTVGIITAWLGGCMGLVGRWREWKRRRCE